MQDLKQLIQQYQKEAFDLRDALHREPELAFEEFKTNAKVRAFLDRHHIDYDSPIAKTGILATVKGKFPGKTVLLRGDMDALPIQEDLTHSNPSQIAGKMHACGHDGHTASLALSAVILNQVKDQIHGTIKFLFQPAEEAIGGAKVMIEEGALKGVDAAFGGHLWGLGLENTAATKKGPFMASPDTFKIIVHGKAGHASRPQLAIDSILVASQIVVNIQSVMARQVDPFETAVISIGKMQGGTASNIIADEVVIEGTIRSIDESVRNEIPKKMQKLVEGIATSYGAQAEFIYEPQYPVLVNHPEITEIALSVLKEVLGKDHVEELQRADMGGEDFAYIAQTVPSCFMFVGIAKDKDHLINHHTPYFDFKNPNIAVLSEVLMKCALSYLDK